MMTTTEFLDAAKAKHGLASDYKLGMVLGLSDAAVGHYRKGRSRMDDRVCMRIAELLDVAPEYVVACVHAERADSMGDTDLGDVWRGVAAKFLAAERKLSAYARAAVFAFFAVILSAFWGGGPDGGALAATPSYHASAAPESVYYVNFSRRFRALLDRVLWWLFAPFPRFA